MMIEVRAALHLQDQDANALHCAEERQRQMEFALTGCCCAAACWLVGSPVAAAVHCVDMGSYACAAGYSDVGVLTVEGCHAADSQRFDGPEPGAYWKAHCQKSSSATDAGWAVADAETNDLA
eukprot:TRINITY_DN35400_c0_g1_i1.p2 TRINITY_DN35400_c0_g1~~TRINITY_DN35400_c0_g1_i1.p2  ORF type:complete len:122 (+),score=26.10 TRINITY_DN35400_c0_g1_i1:320-685(+)